MTFPQWLAPPPTPWTRTMCSLSLIRCSLLCGCNGRFNGEHERRPGDSNPRKRVVARIKGSPCLRGQGGSRLSTVGSVLLGRGEEQTAIERVLDAARAG